MGKKNQIPEEYFTEQEFIQNGVDEDLVEGILGKNPSAEQILKFELCSSIAHIINKKELSLSEVAKITKINASDISRIKNYHLDRFTIDRLIKIYCLLDSTKGIAQILESTGARIRKSS